MSLRTVVLICAVAGIPLALLVLALPITWGYGGYLFASGTTYSRVFYSDPSGPAYAAGLRVGQRVIANKGNEFVQEDAGPVGTVVREHVLEPNGRIRVIRFTFPPFTGALAVQQQIDKFVNALTALGAFIIAILVLLRARNQRVGVRAAAVLFFSAVVALSMSGSLVCGNAWVGEVLKNFIPNFAGAAAYWSGLSLLAIFPPHRAKLRAVLWWYGAVVAMSTLLGGIAYARFIATGRADPTLISFDHGHIHAAIFLVSNIVMFVAIADAIASARDEDAAPVRWLGCMWFIANIFSAAPAVQFLAGGTSLATHYGDFVNAAYVFFLALGVAYPILRYRIVDLNIIVSRATVFTVVSMIIVGVFVAAEWGIAKVFEQSFGLSHDKSGVAAQLLTLVIVLVLGMSARSIHRFIEERLTRAFFRKRLQGLSAIERVAREADAATDAADLIRLGAQTVKHALNPAGVAYYLHRGEAYERCAAEGTSLQQLYRFNDGVPLRLRRWQEPFEIDDNSDERFHLLFVPMSVRGDLVGFLCCGPKPDRTAYLEDEIKALSLLAHHTAIAVALLPRSSVPESTSGLALAPM